MSIESALGTLVAASATVCRENPTNREKREARGVRREARSGKPRDAQPVTNDGNRQNAGSYLTLPGVIPCSSANFTSAGRSLTPSFLINRLRYVSTVLGERCTCCAISVLEWPSTTS